MAGYTPTVRNGWLDGVFNSGTPYVSLHSGDPGTTGANELSGNGYARSNATSKFNAASAGALDNSAVISFGPATGSDWPEAAYFGIFTDSSAGTFKGGWPLTNPQTVQVPNTASFDVGALTASITNA